MTRPGPWSGACHLELPQCGCEPEGQQRLDGPARGLCTRQSGMRASPVEAPLKKDHRILLQKRPATGVAPLTFIFFVFHPIPLVT